MKVLTIAPTPFFSDRGCHIRIYEQMNEVQRRGHEVLVATYGMGRNLPDLKTDRARSVLKKDTEYSFLRRIIQDFFLFLHVLALKRKFKPDILHCYLHVGFLIGFVASGFSSKRIVFDSQGMLVQEMIEKRMIGGDLVIKFVKMVEKFIYRSAGVIFVSSETIKSDIMEGYGVGGSSIQVVPDVPARDIIDPVLGDDQIVVRETKTRLGLPEDKTILIFTGFMDQGSGIDILIRSLKILKEQEGVPPFFGVLIGYPEEKYKQMAEDEGCASIMTFLGKTDYFRLKEYLAVADIAVAPKVSLTEAHGKIINYLAAGLPVVCFESTVNREIAGDFAIYASERDPSSYAQAIRGALLCLGESRSQKEERRRFVRERHSWRSTIDTIEETYRRLAELK